LKLDSVLRLSPLPQRDFFAFLFVDLLNNSGTLIGVRQRANLV